MLLCLFNSSSKFIQHQLLRNCHNVENICNIIMWHCFQFIVNIRVLNWIRTLPIRTKKIYNTWFFEQVQRNSVITKSVVNEHLVVTNTFLWQIDQFTEQINPVITNPGYNEQKCPLFVITEFDCNGIFWQFVNGLFPFFDLIIKHTSNWVCTKDRRSLLKTRSWWKIDN